jgi:hypothetical protein
VKVDQLNARLRYLYFPFLLLGVGLAVGYTAADWLLTIKTELLVLDDEIVGYWLPVGLAFLAFFLVFRGRLKGANWWLRCLPFQRSSGG